MVNRESSLIAEHLNPFEEEDARQSRLEYLEEEVARLKKEHTLLMESVSTLMMIERFRIKKHVDKA